MSDPLARLLARARVSSSVAARARAIYKAANPPKQGDQYLAACALYLVTAANTHKPSSSLSSIINTVPKRSLITDFFTVSKHASVPSAAKPSSPSIPVADIYQAFMVSAETWRQMCNVLAHPDVSALSSTSSPSRSPSSSAVSPHRLAWLFFIVSKACLHSVDTAMSSEKALHLLLATLLEAGFVRSPNTSVSPLKAVCEAFHVLPEAVLPCLDQLPSSLPHPILKQLPLYQRATDPTHAEKICQMLDQHYNDMLNSFRRRPVDERIFLEASHLFAFSQSAVPIPKDRHDTVPDATSPTKPPSAHVSPSNSRKRRLPAQHSRSSQDHTPETPKTRRRVLNNQMQITPTSSKTLNFAASPRADALDTLAAVASTTPVSPAPSLSTNALTPTPTRKGRPPPATSRKDLSPQEWLLCTVASRPEPCVHTDKDLTHIEVVSNSSVSPILAEEVRDIAVRHKLSDDASRLCHIIITAEGDVAEPGKYRRDAMAIYFTSLDGILKREGARLRKCGNENMLLPKLVKNSEFHRTLMALSWECAISAYGRYDMRMLWTAMRALKLTPFALFKVMESFIKSFFHLPNALSSHMLTCDARLIESLVWARDSELVRVIAQGKADNVKARVYSASTEELAGRTEEMQVNETEKNSAKPNVLGQSKSKEYVMNVAFKRLLRILSVRTQEILMLLGMDRLALQVWACLKHCIWRQWHLLVDRHVDQIMLCCIYAVAKVRKIDLLFRDIIWMYRTMSHVRHVSFTTILPDLTTSVSLNSRSHHGDLVDVDGGRGDIIKFYNDVFVTSAREIILAFRPSPSSTFESSTATMRPQPSETGVSRTKGSAQAERDGRRISDETYMEIDTKMGAQQSDRLQEEVLTSPLRIPRHHKSPRRVGRITVSVLSPTKRSSTTLNNSARRRGRSMPSNGTSFVMAPDRHILYASGEAAVRSGVTLDGRSSPKAKSRLRDASDDNSSSPTLQPRLLSFDHADVFERSVCESERLNTGPLQKSIRSNSPPSNGCRSGVNRGPRA